MQIQGPDMDTVADMPTAAADTVEHLDIMVDIVVVTAANINLTFITKKP